MVAYRIDQNYLAFVQMWSRKILCCSNRPSAGRPHGAVESNLHFQLLFRRVTNYSRVPDSTVVKVLVLQIELVRSQLVSVDFSLT